jgi:hypothetical protein
VFIGSLRGLHRLIPGIPSVDYSKPRVNAGTGGEYQQLYSRSLGEDGPQRQHSQHTEDKQKKNPET